MFRALGNGSRLLLVGDSVSRLSAMAAMCELMSTDAADFHTIRYHHHSPEVNEGMQNETRPTLGGLCRRQLGYGGGSAK